MTATVLVYLGTILVAFDVVNEISNVPTLVLLLFNRFYHYVAGHVQKMTSSISPRLPRTVLRVVVMLPLIIPLVSLALVVVLSWLVEQILRIINTYTNRLYQSERKRVKQIQPELLASVVHRFVPKATDEDITKAIEHPIHFVALIGLSLIIVGFILQVK